MIAQFKISSSSNLWSELGDFLVSQGWVRITTPSQETAFQKGVVCITAGETKALGMANSKTSLCDSFVIRLLSPTDYSNATTYKETHVPGCGPICNVHSFDEGHQTFRHEVGILTKSGGTCYINYSEVDKISCVISMKSVIDSVDVWQHVSFGEILTSIDVDGGSYLSATRSKFAIYPQNYTAGCIDATSAPVFGMSKYGNTYAYVNIEGASDDINKHTTRFPASCYPMTSVRRDVNSDGGKMWFCNYGTGKVLATSISDVGYFGNTPAIPSYKYMQSNKPGDPNRMIDMVNGISVNLPIDVYVQRDPIKLDNYSYIGKFPNVLAISVKNMADASIHCLTSRDGTDMESYQIFPHSIRCGRHGYDGIAVRYDVTDYGNAGGDTVE